MPETVQRTELAAFLRARREAIDPAALGLPAGSRRRTPGLRREEVAQLSGVSLTWYTWLEQGRDIRVSRQVIESIARVLRMDATERAHLFTLAELPVPREPLSRPGVHETLRRLVDTLNPNPAYVIDAWWDILAYNTSYEALVGDLESRSAQERNIIWLTFTDERVREVLVDWSSDAPQLAGQLRAHLAQRPDDPRGTELVEALKRSSKKFCEIWELPEVRRFKPARKRLRHPVVGRIDLDYLKLAAVEEEQDLIVFLPADDGARAKLHGVGSRHDRGL